MANVQTIISAEQRAAAEEQIVEQSKRIDFYITEYSVEMLANKMRAQEYVVPAYQREFTWEDERRSKFLESLIMGLPIPFIFFWEMPDGRLEIVDGSQRLRTIEEFLLGDFRLGGLEQLDKLSGFRFVDLPESRQRKVRNRSIRGIVLNEHADDAARLDMFERINTGSKIANKAEIRRGALAGPFLTLVIDLAKDERLKRLAPMSEKSKQERGYEELVTRFFAYGDGLEGYKDRPADFIFNHAKRMNGRFESNPALADDYRQRFHRTMEFIERVFPHGFRKGATGRATPRARFEAIAIGSYLAMKDKPELAERSWADLDVNYWIDGPDFTAVTGSDGANARARLEGRMEFVRKRLVES
ncbi:DUF262 domain-containing protein [Micromonospora taraxaci]|uniref:DUF262 domain-containing protein n=1 Tax=Micromonospora taraxaci TaxID=1316803 RepID=UPI003C2E5A6A